MGNAALSTLKSLAASPAALTAALGVPVERVDAAPQLVSSAISVGDGDTSNEGMGLVIAGIGAVGGTVLLVMMAVALYCFRRQRLKRRFTPETVDAQSIEIDVESAAPPEPGSSIAHEPGSGTANEPGSSTAKAAAGRGGMSPTREYASNASSISSGSGTDANNARPQSARTQRALQSMVQWEWSADRIEWKEQLGAGSFGKVLSHPVQ